MNNNIVEDNIVSKAIDLLTNSTKTNYRISIDTGISQTALARYKKGESLPTQANATLLVQYLQGNIQPKNEAKPSTDLNFMQVPMIPVSARAGYLSGYGDEEFIDGLPTIPVIVDKSYKGKYRVFDIEGDSMYDGSINSLCDNDKVLCRDVKKHLWTSKLHINDWYFVIVHREEGIIVKQIIDHNIETGDIKCHSLNPMFQDFTLNLNDVLELYNVIKVVDRTARI